jgi:hypothetical protein
LSGEITTEDARLAFGCPHREIGKTDAFTFSVASDWHAAISGSKPIAIGKVPVGFAMKVYWDRQSDRKTGLCNLYNLSTNQQAIRDFLISPGSERATSRRQSVSIQTAKDRSFE